MRISHFLIALIVSLPAFAAEDPKEAAARKDCDAKGEAAGNEAVKTTPLQSPADVTFVKQKAKQIEVIKCMRAAGYASGPIRAK